MKFNIQDYPIVFLSYDEPNADTNYSRLLEVCNTALRVSGIKGSDTAHKAVAELVEGSSRVTIIDGDNYVLDDLLNFQIDILDSINFNNSVVSISSYNPLNGNCYGNGSIKNWPVKLLKDMRTHENSDDDSSIDFDFTKYLQVNRYLSETHINSSPQQAWRAGFREGMKLCMENNKFVTSIDQINWRNYERLWRWTHVGSDVENGIYAIHGARTAMQLAFTYQYDISKIRDFDFLNELASDVLTMPKDKIVEECNRLGNIIKIKTKDGRFKNVLRANESNEFRKIPSSLRSPEEFIRYKYYPPYDVVFISYDEPNADQNYEKLKERYPNAKRVDGVKGIHKAHITAAKLCNTDYFWVVDGDNTLVDDFQFDYSVNFYEPCKVRVWRCENPINELIYGYGGVKLLPRMYTILMNTDTADMSTSISTSYEPVFKLSSITNFNTSEFHTWRSAFRECTKLSSQVIERQNDKETLERLNTWCTVGQDKPFGKYAIEGARQGRLFGEANKNNPEQLKLINDFNWLQSRFNETYK